MKQNKILAVIISIILVFTSVTVVYADNTAEDNTVVNFAINDAGYFELEGYTDCKEHPWVTMLLTDKNADFNSEKDLAGHIMYIDQVMLGNNGAFYISAELNTKWSGEDYILKINAGGDFHEYTGNLGEFTEEILSVPDNCIRIGADIYSLTAQEYTPNRISRSLANGGNYIFYKIGGYWFNMLNEDATSYAYFEEFNAVPENVWHRWVIENYYYDTTYQYSFFR